jgi:hypothetical protein
MKYAAAAIALAIACPLPASAQKFPVSPGMQVECLKRAIPEETRISAVHAYLESDEASRPDKAPAIAAALDSCGKTHNWSDEQRDMAYGAMMYGTRMDELWDRFNAIKVDTVLASRVASRLMYNEKRPLLDRNWRKDAALEAHVRSLFAAQGITDEETQRLGGDLVHALHSYISLIDRWEAKWPTPAFPTPPPPAPPRPRAPAPPG